MSKRGLTINEAAALCGITKNTYRRWMEKGIVPKPWPGTRRIDSLELERALDNLSGQTNPNRTAYDSWKGNG